MSGQAAAPSCTLSARDRAILQDLDRVRLLTGKQLERLHFAHLATSNARGSARRRSLGRLTKEGWATTLPRRVGGERAGSAGLIYTLDARARRESTAWQQSPGSAVDQRVRRPWAIGWLFVRHSLDVAELYVQLREAERLHQVRILRFDAEPASWFTLEDRSSLKPDAFVVLEVAGWERHTWVEVDRATESLGTIRRKLSRYEQARQGGSRGPDGVLPRVLFTVPDDRRAEQLQSLMNQSQDTTSTFIRVVRFDHAREALPGLDARPPP